MNCTQIHHQTSATLHWCYDSMDIWLFRFITDVVLYTTAIQQSSNPMAKMFLVFIFSLLICINTDLPPPVQPLARSFSYTL